MKNTKRWVGVIGAASAIALMAPSLASADGVQEGPVQWWAEGNDQCEVVFTIANYTNATSYVVDYVIDGEDPTQIEGLGKSDRTGTTYQFTVGGNKVSRTVGRTGVTSRAAEPHFAAGGPGYETGREKFEHSETVSLRDAAGVPNPESDTHTITYQMVRGPENNDKGWDYVNGDIPSFTTEVSGCAGGDEGPGAGSSGSAGSAHLFGSLERIFHHHHRS